MYRIKYRLDNPIIHNGFMIIAKGIGGRKRFKKALHYLNKHGFPKIKYPNLYQAYKHALNRSKQLRELEDKYRQSLSKQRDMNYKKRLIYQQNRRKNKKHLYLQALNHVQSLNERINKLSKKYNLLTIELNAKNNSIYDLKNQNKKLRTEINSYKSNNNYQQRTRVRTQYYPNNNPNQQNYNPYETQNGSQNYPNNNPINNPNAPFWKN